MKIRVLALILCAAAAPAAAQVATPAPVFRGTAAIQSPQMLDPNIAALQASVKALQQENAALKAELAKQDASIGQLLTQIIANKGAINNVQGRVSTLENGVGDLKTRFENHYHTYQRANLTKTNLKVETPDSISWATYVNDFWTYEDKSSGPK